jgi:hypothetical protein
MTPWQDYAAMIDHLRWGQSLKILDRESGPLDQRPSARRTPVG